MDNRPMKYIHRIILKFKVSISQLLLSYVYYLHATFVHLHIYHARSITTKAKNIYIVSELRAFVKIPWPFL